MIRWHTSGLLWRLRYGDRPVCCLYPGLGCHQPADPDSRGGYCTQHEADVRRFNRRPA
jgi:hypothetical protein